jgi:hypothetical protein
MAVTAAPETTGTTGTQPAADNTLIFGGIIAAVIVAIVIGFVNLLVLSKRKKTLQILFLFSFIKTQTLQKPHSTRAKVKLSPN